MDLLESYDSDEETLTDSTQDDSNSKNPLINSLEEYRNKYIKGKPNKQFNNINSNGLLINSNIEISKSNEISLLSFDDKDNKTTLRSRLYSDYDRFGKPEKLDLKGQNDEIHKKSKEETVPFDSNRSNLSVVSVELGSRNNPSGLLKTYNEFDTSSMSDKSLDSLRKKSENRLKTLHKEHTRKEEDMMYENYPVDHPSYKSHSTLSNYTRDGTTYCLSQSFGSVNANPGGVTEKVYFNEVAFQDDLLKNDIKVVLNNDLSVLDKKRRRLTPSEVKSDDVFGPWIPFEEGELPVSEEVLKKSEDNKIKEKKTKSTNQLGSSLPKYSPEQCLSLNEVVVTDGKQITKFNDINVSTFNRKVDSHYKTWVVPPKNIKHFDRNTYKSFLPKQEVFTYLGHTMAVQKIEFFPNTGHLMLSASMDGFVKIWDVNSSRKCIRTYKGHSKGVRDISFLENGYKFFSLSFDFNAILWDTEYGKIVGIYPIDKTPYCLAVYPEDESIFVVGGENKKACQFDSRTGEMVLEYSEHLGCVNTVTFIDGNRRILTTGDDKKLLVWDYNIPVSVKQISNPAMHTIPAVINHPNDKFVLAQSMDNQIVVFESSGSRFKQFGRKKFRGHQNSGYAIKPSCSPDGRYVTSGDSRGKLFIWDWKTCKNLQTFTGHKAVTMDCKWHPTYPSTLATCSWDGTIKLWE